MDQRFRELLKCARNVGLLSAAFITVQCIAVAVIGGSSFGYVFRHWWQYLIFAANLAVLFCAYGTFRVASLELSQRPTIQKWVFVGLLLASTWVLEPLKLGYPNFLTVSAVIFVVLELLFGRPVAVKSMAWPLLGASIWMAYTNIYENYREFFTNGHHRDFIQPKSMPDEPSVEFYLLWTINLFFALMVFFHYQYKFHQSLLTDQASAGGEG